MLKRINKIIVIVFLIFQSCSQIGEIKTNYTDSDGKYFTNKEYKIKNNLLHNSSYVVKDIVFSSTLVKTYVPIDTIKFYNDKSNYIIIKCDDNGILVAMDEDDSYNIHIKIDTLSEKEYELNDDNTVIKRNFNMAKFKLSDIKGSILIKSLSEEKICCDVNIQTNEIIQNNKHIPFTGMFSGSFCLPVKNN